MIFWSQNLNEVRDEEKLQDHEGHTKWTKTWENNHCTQVRNTQQVLTFSVLVLVFRCLSCWNSAALTECWLEILLLEDHVIFSALPSQDYHTIPSSSGSLFLALQLHFFHFQPSWNINHFKNFSSPLYASVQLLF